MKYKFDFIDDYVVMIIFEELKSFEEYLMRILKDYKDFVEVVVFEFKGGFVSYI